MPSNRDQSSLGERWTRWRERARRWAPRVWMGCSMRSWWQLLRRHRFAVDARHLYIAIVDSVTSIVNTALGAVEHGVYGKQIANATIAHDPLFVIGHWRSGTTLLHELLCLDLQHACPTTYECLAPHHFLLTESILPRLINFLLPDRRPVDEMKLRWDSAFEDEFALCLLGARSPYETIAFPNETHLRPDLFDPDRLTPAESQAWRRLLNEFLRKLSVRHHGRRLVLKSPPHTCRITVLLDMFPRARFVHIVRNPYDVFASTVHLWRTLHRTQGLQTPRGDNLEEPVLSTFEYLHACVERDRSRIAPGQFHELRFEDLLENPVREMQVLYERLGLEQTEQVREAIRVYFAARVDFQMNRLQISTDERATVGRRWGHVIARHGYCNVRDPISPASSEAIT